jgi:polysaccharide deacetylase 2 family uncharacterized protein YibQ
MAMPRPRPIRRKRRRKAPPELRVAHAVFWLVLISAGAIGVWAVASQFQRLFAPAVQVRADVAPAMRSSVSTDEAQPLNLRSEMNEDAAPLPDKPVIAIVIDDLGGDVAHTARAIQLPRKVALAFLPYPRDTPRLAHEAARVGHEVLVHLPMQAQGPQDPGPMALSVALPPEENVRRLDWALSRVPDFVGINNHEGSLFTANAQALDPVMARVAERRVFFFDSRTTPASQVVTVARAHGVESADRDVFLDDVVTLDAVDAQLHALEAKARSRGAAIAIGHPNEITLDAVAYWTAHEQGFELVTLKTAIRAKTERALQAMR